MIIRPEAEADLEDARDWYESQRDGLGDEFLECVEEALQKIDLMPEMYRVVDYGIRRAFTDRFPFTIYYRIEANDVVVLGVLHSRRDPRVWKSRR